MELDLLGSLLIEALKFRDSGFDENIVLMDRVTNSELKASELFNPDGQRHFVRYESLPGDLTIKAVAVDAEGLYVEVSPLDLAQVKAVISEEMLPTSFVSDEGVFCDVHSTDVLMTVSVPSRPDKELGFRSLITIPLVALSSRKQEVLVEILDALYVNGGFTSEEVDEEISSTRSSPGQPQGIRIELNLQHRLMTEQRPLLSLTNRQRYDGTTKLTLEFQQVLSLSHRILNMNEEQLFAFATEYAGKHGEQGAKSVLLFALAGKVKSAFPKLPWKASRKLAGKLLKVGAK